jgi:tetratricopeptide (TPR) repeat protein
VSLIDAARCLQLAYTLDPGYAPAMALAGWLYFERASNGWVEDRVTEGAAVLTLAQRAVELNSNDPNVLWMSANSFWYLKADAERGRELFARSLSMNPNSPLALTMSAWLEMSFSELDIAIERISRAMRLSPRDPREWMMSASMGMAKMWGRKFAESLVWCDRAILQNPRMLPALRVKIVALAHLGEREKAAEVAKEVLRIDPQFSISTWRNQRAPAAFRGENPAWNLFYEGLRAAGVPE